MIFRIVLGHVADCISCGFLQNLRHLYDAHTIVLRSHARLSQDCNADLQDCPSVAVYQSCELHR